MGQRKSAPKAAKPKAPAKKQKRGSSAQAERGPHTPEGAGSKPAPATRNARSLEAPAVKKAPSPRKPPGSGTAKKPAPGHQDNAPPDTIPNSTPSPSLNARQRAFVVEYLKEKNATKAYMAVYGVSQASAETAGPRLLGNVRVRTEVDRLEQLQLAQVQAETGITLERTLREIAKVAFHDPRKFFDAKGNLLRIPDLDADTAAALAGFDVDELFDGAGRDKVHVGDTKKIKLSQRAPYLEMLMKHLGGYAKDNSQQHAPLAEALREFIGGLHQSNSRLPMVPRA